MEKINTVNSEYVNKVPSSDVPLHLYLSVLGMPGQTAYHGLLDIGQPKEGETVVISAASVQLAQLWAKLRNLKVAESLV